MVNARCPAVDPSRGRGFTLIELLVVLAIMALLASIALTSLSQAREAARSMMCLNTFHHTAVGMTSYVHDQGGSLPTVGYSHTGEILTTQGSWFFQLERYLDAELLAACPSDQSAFWSQPGADERLRVVSYAASFTLGLAFGFERYAKIDAIPNPAATIYAVELTEGGVASEPTHTGMVFADHVHPETWVRAAGAQADEIVGYQVEIDQHLQRSNYLFLDGHAASHDRAETFNNQSGSVIRPVWTANKYWPQIAR